MSNLKYANKAHFVSIACEGTFQSKQLTYASDVAALLKEHWPKDIKVRESCLAIYLSRSTEVLAIMCLSVGSSTSTIIDAKIVMAPVLQLAGCNAIILSHNHPSGQLRASPLDIKVTKKIKAACKIFDVAFLDHIIITSDGWYSLNENKLM